MCGGKTASLVRVEAIVTSLVFDHALRIRHKAETQSGHAGDLVKPYEFASGSEDNDNEDINNNGTSIDDAGDSDESTAVDTSQGARSRSDTVASGSTSTPNAPNVSAKLKDDAQRKSDKAGASPASKGDNLAGKINNLVTSDLDNITNGRDFLFLGMDSQVRIHGARVDSDGCSLGAQCWARRYKAPLRCGSFTSFWGGGEDFIALQEQPGVH